MDELTAQFRTVRYGSDPPAESQTRRARQALERLPDDTEVDERVESGPSADTVEDDSHTEHTDAAGDV